MHATRWHLPVVVAAAGLLIGGAELSSNHTAVADAITDKIAIAQHQLAADGSSMQRLRAELAAAQQQQAGLEKAIADLDGQIAQTEGQVSTAQAQLDAIDASLSAAQDNLTATRARVAADRGQLRKELVVMYKAENASTTFSNLVNSGDFNSYWQHLLDVHRLGSSEQHLVATVTAEELSVTADVTRIGTEKQQQAALLKALHGIVGQLSGALSTRRQAQDQLAQLQGRDNRLLALAEQSAREVKAQIAKLQKDEAAALAAGGGNGHFAWPLTGPMTQGFGCTTFDFEPWDARCPTHHFHSGIDIADPCGSSVAAADSGIAHVYSSSYGYGNHVIIVHGNGWVSVYGHLSTSTVGEGQTVRRGQQVGIEGSTGNSTGCHLHFEVDLNGTATNPLAYLS